MIDPSFWETFIPTNCREIWWGCLRLTLPEDVPELDKIRGSMEEQKKAVSYSPLSR